MPKVQHIKLRHGYYADVQSGKKSFELRKNDRDYQLDDILIMHEWDDEVQRYADTTPIVAPVTYILNGPEAEQFGVKRDYCVMSVKTIDLASKDVLSRCALGGMLVDLDAPSLVKLLCKVSTGQGILSNMYYVTVAYYVCGYSLERFTELLGIPRTDISRMLARTLRVVAQCGD